MQTSLSLLWELKASNFESGKQMNWLPVLPLACCVALLSYLTDLAFFLMCKMGAIAEPIS
jgi:hypothetical protein